MGASSRLALSLSSPMRTVVASGAILLTIAILTVLAVSLSGSEAELVLESVTQKVITADALRAAPAAPAPPGNVGKLHTGHTAKKDSKKATTHVDHQMLKAAAYTLKDSSTQNKALEQTVKSQQKKLAGLNKQKATLQKELKGDTGQLKAFRERIVPPDPQRQIAAARRQKAAAAAAEAAAQQASARAAAIKSKASHLMATVKEAHDRLAAKRRAEKVLAEKETKEANTESSQASYAMTKAHQAVADAKHTAMQAQADVNRYLSPGDVSRAKRAYARREQDLQNEAAQSAPPETKEEAAAKNRSSADIGKAAANQVINHVFGKVGNPNAQGANNLQKITKVGRQADKTFKNAMDVVGKTNAKSRA